MDIIQPPTSDYVPASVLTTLGDIIVRGVAAPERLDIGIAKQLLRVNESESYLEYANEYDILTTPGDIIVHGFAVPERKGIGTALQLLRVNAEAQDIEYISLTDIFQKARIYKETSTQSIPYLNLTVVTYNTVDYDVTAITDLANERITPTLPGYYLVCANTTFNIPSLLGNVTVYLRKNGSEESFHNHPSVVALTVQQTVSDKYVAYFNGSTDYADVAIFHDLSTPIIVNIGREKTWLSVLGPF